MVETEYEVGKLYPKQKAFCLSRKKYTCYGGARGGGKSYVVRKKDILLALNYPGIQILLLRRTLQELRENHVVQLIKELRCEQDNKIAVFKESTKEFKFKNGSRIVLGYCDKETDVLQFQGQAYEVICMEEATHFTEFQFNCLTECNRLSGQCKVKIEPRMYFTCNPGGVGHAWVKRLFIDRDYREKEDAEDYEFIPALVFENEYLIENDPGYIKTLENLPEERKKAMLYGNWDVFDGQYFPEFNRATHVIEPFEIPKEWAKYFVMDYGLDMLAGYWIAVDYFNNFYIYREIYESNLIVSDACNKIKKLTQEEIYMHLAPPDLWNRNRETGKSTADIFADNGIDLYKTNNDRIAGWYAVKEALKIQEDEQETKTSKMKIFSSCKNLIRCIPQLQYDEKKVNDVSNTPHELTHGPDAIRGFCIYWTQAPEIQEIKQDILPKELQTQEEIEEELYWEKG